MRFPWTAALFIVAAVASRSVIGDSQVSGTQGSRFRAGVDVVTLNVTVTDESRRYVTDLEQHDFEVFEDGRKQELMFFQNSGVPLTLVLLLDTSASMQESLGFAQEAAVAFARGLEPADQASVINFHSTVRVLQGFTNDRGAIERAIRQTVANGSTALYNAMYIALREIDQTAERRSAQPCRQAIVLLSDGDDTSSLIGFDEVLDAAARADTTIYAIGLGLKTTLAPRNPSAEFVLRRFAEQTGGRLFLPLLARELAAVYAEIKAELSSQYSLAYESTNTRRDGQFRHVTVRVNRGGTVARAKPGYYAPTR